MRTFLSRKALAGSVKGVSNEEMGIYDDQHVWLSGL